MIATVFISTGMTLVLLFVMLELMGWGADLHKLCPSYWISRSIRHIAHPCPKGFSHDFGVIEMSAGYMHARECAKCGAKNPRQGSIAPWDVHRYV